MVFKPKIGRWYGISLAAFIVVIAAILALILYNGSSRTGIIVPLVFPLLLIVWNLVGTSYRIEDKNLHYTSGFLNGSIPIQSIKKIEKKTVSIFGMRAALSTRGLLVTFGYDEMFISPREENLFIEAIKSINPNIVVQ